ncbi:hypothetical protein [Pseudomonas sp. R5-89-07]|uniref:hypothetical protein n=1 Tax=Pseudomonas sp. R5-89-07 TaxID=658644 RepID=UPI000F5791E9|nr:hypothetical protein [Pseudomonas sp. R5-89-07]AZF07240.1 hypothetical protein C4J94_4503 [Pseudomonas sp. R5-89-07]
MNILPKLNIDSVDVFDACVSSIKDPGLRAKFVDSKNDILAEFRSYVGHAALENLSCLKSCEHGKDWQTIIKSLTKGHFKQLYTQCMVGPESNGRVYYDKILNSIPLSMCPLCDLTHVDSVDHFASKSRYPLFSVLVDNLVPACMKCNKSKGASVISKKNESLHPYFEHSILTSEPWLYAQLKGTALPVAKFFVDPPAHWSPQLKKRISNYFQDLELESRYAKRAASEIADLLSYSGDLSSRAKEFATIATVERAKKKNLWKAALYEALASQYSSTL